MNELVIKWKRGKWQGARAFGVCKEVENCKMIFGLFRGMFRRNVIGKFVFQIFFSITRVYKSIRGVL